MTGRTKSLFKRAHLFQDKDTKLMTETQPSKLFTTQSLDTKLKLFT